MFRVTFGLSATLAEAPDAEAAGLLCAGLIGEKKSRSAAKASPMEKRVGDKTTTFQMVLDSFKAGRLIPAFRENLLRRKRGTGSGCRFASKRLHPRIEAALITRRGVGVQDALLHALVQR